MPASKRTSSSDSLEGSQDFPAKRLRGGGSGSEPNEDYYPDDEDLIDEIEPPEEMDSPELRGASDALFSDITTKTRERWLRPANQVKDNGEDLSIQWFDMDMMGGNPLPKNPNESKSRVVGATSGQVPIIRAYGVSEAGNSVAVFIHGFTPYGYFALPAGSTFQNTEENLTKIRKCIDNRLEGAARGSRLSEHCRAVSYITSHKSIMGYESPHTHFFKIMVAMPTLIPTLKRIMEEGIDLAGVQCGDDGSTQYSAFECNVPFVLRYMIDQDISGAGWMTLPKKTYQLRNVAEKVTNCQVRSNFLFFCCPVSAREPQLMFSFL